MSRHRPEKVRVWRATIYAWNTMTEALTDFAQWADPDGRKVLVRIVDNAGWHIAGQLAVPANVILHHRPSCTPELQPVEPLWPLV